MPTSLAIMSLPVRTRAFRVANILRTTVDIVPARFPFGWDCWNVCNSLGSGRIELGPYYIFSHTRGNCDFEIWNQNECSTVWTDVERFHDACWLLRDHSVEGGTQTVSQHGGFMIFRNPSLVVSLSGFGGSLPAYHNRCENGSYWSDPPILYWRRAINYIRSLFGVKG